MTYLQLLASGAIASFAFLAAAPSARADAVLDMVRRLNLIGTWSSNCAQPASSSNAHIRYYASSDGTARRVLERGSDYPPLDGAVDRAERLTSTTIRMSLRNDDANRQDQNGRSFDVVIEVTGNTSRSISSIGSDGVQYLSEGKFCDGRPTPVLNRCR
jgi:hypothetical protein